MKTGLIVIKWLLFLYLPILAYRIIYSFWLAGQTTPEQEYWKQRLLVNSLWFIGLAIGQVFLVRYLARKS